MPRRKDAVLHASLAKDQVTEALNLLWEELSNARTAERTAKERVDALTAEFVKVRDAAVSLGIDTTQLDK